MAEFFDDYWWAVFLFLIFMGTVAFKPVPRRPQPPRGDGASEEGSDGGSNGDGGGD